MADLKYPADLKYTKSDEWVRMEGDVATIGISDFAQDALNDLVYLEYKVSVGEQIGAQEAFADIESVKAASEIYSMLAGEVLELNSALEGSPDTVNADPYGSGWMIKLRVSDTGPLAGLMDVEAYKEYCASR